MTRNFITLKILFIFILFIYNINIFAEGFEEFPLSYNNEILDEVYNAPVIGIRTSFDQPDPGNFIINENGYKLYRYSSIDKVHDYVVGHWNRSDYWPYFDNSKIGEGNRHGYSLYPTWNITGELGFLFNTSNKFAVVSPNGDVIDYFGRPGNFHLGETSTPRWDVGGSDPETFYCIVHFDTKNDLGQNIKNPFMIKMDGRDYTKYSAIFNFASFFQEKTNLIIASHSDHLTQSWDTSGRAFHFDVGGYLDSNWIPVGMDQRGLRLIYDFDLNNIIEPKNTMVKNQPYLLGSTRTGVYFLNAWGTIYDSNGEIQIDLNNYTRTDGTAVSGLNGHAGYAFNDGVQCWVYFESARDMIVVYNPVTQKKWDLISHQNIGYQGNHIANTPPQLDNWVLISTYKSDINSPDHPMLDKMFFINLESKEIKMIGDCYKVRSGYWTETQANVSVINNETIRVSFSSNWNGTDNIEGYYYELPLSEFIDKKSDDELIPKSRSGVTIDWTMF